MTSHAARAAAFRPRRCAAVLCVWILCSARPAWGELVLLDEQWRGESPKGLVHVRHVDTRVTGDPSQAKEGCCSGLVEDAAGWPEVRFCTSQPLALAEIPRRPSRVRLWYRTNAGAGRWALELWMFHGAAGRMAKVFESSMDGGGQGGQLIADDRWHQAVGSLVQADQYAAVPAEKPLPVFVRLVPTAGWGKPHRTYIDLVEITAGETLVAVASPAGGSPLAGGARRGAQTNGPHWIWWEAEDAWKHSFPAGGAFAPATPEEREKLSNGKWLQHHRAAGLTAAWQVEVTRDGRFGFWGRKFWKHGPFRWRWNRGAWHTCGTDVALADDVSIRQHVNANWVYLGEVSLPRGSNLLEIEVLPSATAAAFDCWLLIQGRFLPNGPNKPGTKYNRAEEGWFPFEPDPDPFSSEAWLDLRSLNQRRAGDDGFVQARGAGFVFEKSGEPVRFWGVNARCDFDDRSAVTYLARRLAKLGVNMVRIHGRVWDESDTTLERLDRRRLDQLHYFVHAMASEGIYTKISFYFPLWLRMRDAYGFPGYKPGEHPFALLFFHPKFQEIYKSWARELFTTRNPYTGKALAADPAVAIVEMVNEDNYLFWTFKPGVNPPAAVMQPLEEAFGKWLAAKYGSLERAAEAWGTSGPPPGGDDFSRGRVGLYGAGHLTSQAWARQSRNEKRASDQLHFLTEQLRAFYRDMAGFFRNDLGVRCALSATNWRTADPPTLDALDKYTNLACDVIDRHAYLDSRHEGEGAAYSLRAGHTYVDTTGMYGPDSLTRELQYVGHPHIVSEYNYPLPNRFRAEAPWLAATYGRLAGTDAFLHFAIEEADWLRGHTKFSVDSPAIMGQFPAAALVFRKGYVKEGPVVSHWAARLADLFAFRGGGPAEPAKLDPLRKADTPGSTESGPARPALDPLTYYVGQVTAEVGENPGASKAAELGEYISREQKVVRSATGELIWSWGRGVAVLNSPCAQGACGFLGGVPAVNLEQVSIRFKNEYGAVLLVPLDDQPLATSGRMLLQVMTEDRNYGWRTEEVTVQGKPKKKIASLGGAPIVVRNIQATIALKRDDAAELQVTALDYNGYPLRKIGPASEAQLLPNVLHYVIHK